MCISLFYRLKKGKMRTITEISISISIIIFTSQITLNYCLIRYQPVPDRSLIPTVEDTQDPTAKVLADVIQKLGGGTSGNCHVMLYYDVKTVSQTQLKQFQDELAVPVSLLDVTLLKFGLVTVKSGTKALPVVDLLMNRPEEDRCRIILSWSESHYQRGLLILARFQPGILKTRDTIVLSTNDNTIDKFIPELRNRVIVRKESLKIAPALPRSSAIRFVVEKSCDDCTSFRLERIGEWQGLYEGLRWEQNQPEYGLFGTRLRVSFTPSVPNIFNINNDTLDGLEFRVLEYAAKALNFSFVLQKPSDNQWGKYINGTWTGKVGDILYNRADLAIGGIVYQADRAKVSDYSTMFHHELWGIVCPPPNRMPLWPYVMFPFRSETSSSVFTLLVIMHVVAYIIVTFVSHFKEENENNYEHPLPRSFRRVFKVSAFLYIRFMACLYFWNLFYCIIKPKYEDPINSAVGLLNSAKTWGLVRGTTVESVLSNSLDSYHREVSQYSRSLSSISEGLFNLEKNDMCIVGVPKRYIKSMITTRYTTECGEAALHVSSEDLHTVLGGWLMAKKSPLKNKLDPIIMRLQGFGFMEKWRSDLYEMLSKRREEKLPCIKRPLGPLTLADLRLAFFLIMGGWGASVILFCLEHIVLYIIRQYQSFLDPDYVDSNGKRWKYPGQREQPQRTWPEQLVNQITNERGRDRNMIMKEAMFRYHMSLLLRNVPSVPVIVNDPLPYYSNPLRPCKRNNISRRRRIREKCIKAKNELEESENTELKIRNQNHLITPSSLEVDTSENIAAVTEVRPYETRLLRAARLFPWSHQRDYSQEGPSSPRFPHRPDSPPPPPQLPHLKDPINNFFERALGGRGGSLLKQTLKEISSISNKVSNPIGNINSNENLDPRMLKTTSEVALSNNNMDVVNDSFDTDTQNDQTQLDIANSVNGGSGNKDPNEIENVSEDDTLQRKFDPHCPSPNAN